MFGGVTIVCGIVGTLAGSFVLDRMTATISNAFKVNACSSNHPFIFSISLGDVSVFLSLPSATARYYIC